MKVELILKTAREIEAYNKGVRDVHNYYEDKINEKIYELKTDIKQNGNYVQQIEVLYELLEKE